MPTGPAATTTARPVNVTSPQVTVPLAGSTSVTACARRTSSPSAMIPRELARSEAWVTTTPLGAEVLPLVNCRNANTVRNRVPTTVSQVPGGVVVVD